MQKIGLTVGDVVDGKFAPHTSLTQGEFSFVKASDNVTVVAFSGFEDRGNGNYVFWDFDVAPYDPVTNPNGFGREEIRVRINAVIQYGYGVITVYPDDDTPPAASYSIGRVDRQGDTIFYWITCVPDPEHEPPFYPYNPSTAPEPDNVLVCNKYVKDNFASLVNDNDYDGYNNYLGYSPTIDISSDEYTLGSPAFNNSLVWKKWVVDNFSSSGGVGNTFPINVNRIVVDSRAPQDRTGKIYDTITEAITYASSQTPSSTSRWEIFIYPHHSTGYTANISLPRWISLIGIGRVRCLGSLLMATTGWSGYDSRVENLEFEGTDAAVEIRNVRAKDCLFHVNGAGGESNLIIDGCQLNNCGLFVQNDVNTEAINNTKINRIQGCYGNLDFPFLSTDKIYSYEFISGDLWE